MSDLGTLATSGSPGEFVMRLGLSGIESLEFKRVVAIMTDALEAGRGNVRIADILAHVVSTTAILDSAIEKNRREFVNLCGYLICKWWYKKNKDVLVDLCNLVHEIDKKSKKS